MSNQIVTASGYQRLKQSCGNFSKAYINSFRDFLKACTFLTSILVAILQSGSVLAEAANEGYFGYLFEDGGDYPVTWTETRYSTGLTGMTHDEDNWYTSQSDCWLDIWAQVECVRRLWRIPVDVDLNTNNQSVWWEYTNGQWVPITPPGVQVIYLPDIRNQQYKLIWVHDLAFHRNNGSGYLFADVTIEEIATGNEYRGIAAINPDTFTLIDLDINWPGSCIAASPDDRLVTVGVSDGTAAAKYVSVDWDLLASQGQLVLTPPEPQDTDNIIPIWDPDGSPSATGPADCDLSISGELLYMIHGGTCVKYNRIEVSDLTIGRVVQVSTNSKLGDISHFDARYDPSTCSGVDGEYFDGLTIWDLDADSRAPGIRGKLHVVAIDDDEAFDLSDDIRMMHYTEEVHVIQSSTATPERGTTNLPYNTLAEGIAGAWDYSKLYIWGSNYPETVIFDKKMDVVPLVFTPPYTLVIGE